MSVKKKRRNPALEPKNLLIIGMTAAAVILVAVMMRLIAPREEEKGFENSAWEASLSESVEVAENALDDEVDSGLTAVYSEDVIATATEATPTETNEESGVPTPDEDVQNGNISYTLPVSGAVTKDYSGDELVFSETMQDWRTHNGIDFAAEDGTDVLAAADGTVEAITENGMMGTTVIILHSGGIRTIYSNLSDIGLVNIGDDVTQGAIIGKTGSTAAAEVSESPHLHFEMSLNEEPINPHDYMQISGNETE
ncbi:MAG: M23 family metallopeptidase [Clostridia bacterium]|nr:M23 family metallopeptidase [Clostridia bacterium]